MNRRDFVGCLGLGAFGSAEWFRAAGLRSVSDAMLPASTDRVIEHWRAAYNNTWRWFERSDLVAGEWRLAGMTLPRRRDSGEYEDGRDCADYLLEADVPEPLLATGDGVVADFCRVREGAAPGPAKAAGRKARDGRPPSHWLRGLSGEELILWLATFNPPRADVEGMTFIEHLTRDHGFGEACVAMLTPAERAKLHGAAHGGY